MSIDNVEKLREVLAEARVIIPDNEFCGIGVIVYSKLEDLPILSLCPNNRCISPDTLAKQLVCASLASNSCHDGFHLISTAGELTHVNQYFAPPLFDSITEQILGDESRGARYVTAVIGSMLANVYCTGILGDRDGLTIFRSGDVVK